MNIFKAGNEFDKGAVRCPYSCGVSGFTKVWVRSGVRYHDFYITKGEGLSRVGILMICRDGMVTK